uniref:Conserved hypothetical plastid protein n=1 Tax=Mastocarpus papillatus TaxID=31436 RepID=A0A342RZP5_9FLOR|nr:conserved hypothetical plastid protein [Mastocarpus papillatus]AOL58191.1 conserved hypothetical plastid protein [Mastocarpus papillatus]
MCICINCKYVNSCSTYQLIQKQHQQDMLNIYTTFTPINTLITININQSYKTSTFDWDLIECLSFTEKPGNWLNKSTANKFNSSKI